MFGDLGDYAKNYLRHKLRLALAQLEKKTNLAIEQHEATRSHLLEAGIEKAAEREANYLALCYRTREDIKAVNNQLYAQERTESEARQRDYERKKQEKRALQAAKVGLQ